MLLNNKIMANLRNKPSSVCYKNLFKFLLILVQLQSLNAASVNLPIFINNTETLNANASRYEYTVDPLPIGLMTPVEPKGQSDDGKNVVEIAYNIMSSSGVSATNNLTAMTWAHAVNSQQELTDALNSNIDMIEADIVMGKINSTGPDMPVMAHPPANSSDLSLDAFLQQIKAYNDNHVQEMKGVKLDFKSIEVFEGALDTLQEKIPQMTYPIWLNADIISGPVDQNNSIPVDPERFFVGSSQFPTAVLSIGWTTRWFSDYNNGSYTTAQIEAMVDAIKNNNVTEMGQPITFPVRAGIAANSQKELHDLVKAVNGTNDSTLTIWSSENDYVDVAKLRQLIFSFGFDRVYLDVPEELSSQLDLGRPTDGTEVDGGNDGAARNTTMVSLMNFSLMSAGIYLISLYLEKLRI